MTNSQIIIFSILGVLWVLSYFKLAYHLDDKKQNSTQWFLLFVMTNALFIVCLVTATLVMNDLQKQVEGKCPELEKVENIYKIKEK